jgi:PAS domain S-box-containing protein
VRVALVTTAASALLDAAVEGTALASTIVPTLDDLPADVGVVVVDEATLGGLSALRALRARTDVPVLVVGEDEALLTVDLVDLIAPPISPARLRAKLLLLGRLAPARLGLHRILDRVPAAIAIVRGPDMIYEYSNDENQRLLGGVPTVGRSAREVLPKETVVDLEPLVQEVSRTGVPFAVREIPVSVEHGGERREFFVNGAYVPLRDARGEPDGILAFAYEVTDLVVARKRSEASEARFRRIYESGVLAIVFWTRDGRIVDANDAFLSMVGYSRAELEAGAIDWRAMTPPEFAPLDATAFAEMEAVGFCSPYEKEYVHRDGHRIPIELGAALAVGSKEDGVAWILDCSARAAAIAARDRSERALRRSIEQERLARAEAESAVRQRDDFLSVASHELRTPLTSLGLVIQLLERALRRGDDHAKLAGYVGRVRAQHLRVKTLVDDLLDVARIGSGRLPLGKAEVDLVALARDVVTRFEADAEIAKVALSLRAPESVRGRYDRARIDQVLTNLVSNALKYGGAAPVEVVVERDEQVARIVVVDRGIGIAPEDQERIFDRFERAPSAQAFGGFGLGLFITRSIVEMHGGHVAVESALGEGSRFTVTLPLEDDDAPSGAGPIEASRSGGDPQ